MKDQVDHTAYLIPIWSLEHFLTAEVRAYDSTLNLLVFLQRAVVLYLLPQTVIRTTLEIVVE